MTIRKKDGNLYVLEGPNKLTKNQENWDISKLVFHNFFWEEIVYKNKQPPVKVPVHKEIVEEPEEELEPEEQLEEEEESQVNSEEVDSIKKQILEETKQEQSYDPKDFPILKYKVLLHCLPVKIKSHQDNFYREQWETTTYGKKFIFPAVILEIDDLSMQFWTSDPNNQIMEKSIVFPFAYEVYNQSTMSYDKVPFDEHRWWKVVEKEKKEEGGWVFRNMPSQDQPDFS